MNELKDTLKKIVSVWAAYTQKSTAAEIELLTNDLETLLLPLIKERRETAIASVQLGAYCQSVFHMDYEFKVIKTEYRGSFVHSWVVSVYPEPALHGLSGEAVPLPNRNLETVRYMQPMTHKFIDNGVACMAGYHKESNTLVLMVV